LKRLHTSLLAAAIVIAPLLVGTIGGAYTGRHAGYAAASDRSHPLPNGSIPCKPGPWGDLSYTPFSIAAPDDLLPVRSIEAAGTRWFFKGYTTDSFVSLLQSTSLTPDQQLALVGASVFTERADGVELTPTPDMVFSLPKDARMKLYQILAQSDENDEEVNFIPMDAIDGWFSANGVSSSTAALFRQLCCERGDYFMFSGIAAMLSRLSSYDEKLHFTKALTEQRTLLLRLRLGTGSDVNGLANYWGRGCNYTDVKTIMKSLSVIPTGTSLSVMMLLPDLPSAELYDYPSGADNSLDGPAVNRDCAWSSLNFFNEVPNPSFGTMSGVLKEISANYLPVPDAPRYGDLVLFARPDKYIVHVAVYIADDICFTKNGSTIMHPWMLSTIPEISKQFAFQIDPSQKMIIRYFRKKDFM